VRFVKNDRIAAISASARQAAQAGNWSLVDNAAREILRQDRGNPEGWFLAGLASKAKLRPFQAMEEFGRTLRLDASRYDAAIELAWIYWSQMRHQDARDLLEAHEERLANSPRYLHMAAETWTRLGLHARALPLYRKACALQPDIESFRADLAACAVLCGEIQQAKSIYLGLLDQHPEHQRNHYELSRLERARSDTHVTQMKTVLETTRLPAEKNIFLYYAIAKELEDLGKWDESFQYYRQGGDAAARLAHEAGYTVDQDIALMDGIMETCNAAWLSAGPAESRSTDSYPRPIFVVGLPRTGTTLAERILASHSQVESANETFFLEIAIRRASRMEGRGDITPGVIQAAANADMGIIARTYLDMVRYRLSGKPMFVEKYPFNFLYLGFIARAFPRAHIVHLRRHPLDACFAMYKQSFFRFAYTLEDLARYYVAYDRLSRHWRGLLGDRIIELDYESLVADPENKIRGLLQGVDLEFEDACLDFHLNKAPSATASSVQVREKIHTESVRRWENVAGQLAPLRDYLAGSGIELD